MQHLLLLERELVGVRACQEEVEQRPDRVLLARRGQRRGRAAVEPRGGQLRLHEEVDTATPPGGWTSRTRRPGGESEVDDCHAAVAVHEQIAWVHVPVENPLSV